MKCPECQTTDDKVIDSRETHQGDLSSIRRRRECRNGHRFTTYEHVAGRCPVQRQMPVGILYADGVVEPIAGQETVDAAIAAVHGRLAGQPMTGAKP